MDRLLFDGKHEEVERILLCKKFSFCLLFARIPYSVKTRAFF